MKTSVNNRRRGFTLIEMVGVLAVIAILAALLIPKIFAAINESRLNNAVTSYNSVKSAAMMYFGKYGVFGSVGGTPYAVSAGTPAATNWDATVLLPEGLVEKPFLTKVGTNNFVEVIGCQNAGFTVTGIDDGSFALAGGTTNTAGSGSCVVEAVFQGVASDDALQLAQRIDGPNAIFANGTGTNSTTHLSGRVKYDFAGANMGNVYVYIAHK